MEDRQTEKKWKTEVLQKKQKKGQRPIDIYWLIPYLLWCLIIFDKMSHNPDSIADKPADDGARVHFVSFLQNNFCLIWPLPEMLCRTQMSNLILDQTSEFVSDMAKEILLGQLSSKEWFSDMSLQIYVTRNFQGHVISNMFKTFQEQKYVFSVCQTLDIQE